MPERMRLKAPRALKDPDRCIDSSLRRTRPGRPRSPGRRAITGVTRTWPAIRAAADSIDARSIIPTLGAGARTDRRRVAGIGTGASIVVPIVLIWAGLLSAIGGILLIAIGFGVGATAQALAGANVQTWFGRILPERERRFVAPRALAIQFGLGSVLLVPVALMVRVGEGDWGVMIYAPAFVGALVASLAFIRALRKLPRPGALAPERTVRGGALSAPVRRFIRTNAIAALGAGFAPYLSIYAIVVLNQSAAYAILLSAVGSATALVGALVIGNWLERGSASRLYRTSLIVRGVGKIGRAHV